MISRRSLLAAAPALAFGGVARAAGPGEAQGELHEGLLFVTAAVGAAAGPFLVDTGAPVTLFDRSFAATAGIEAEQHEVLRGVGGATAAARAERLTVTLAGGLGAAVDGSITDLSPIARKMRRPLAGVLGGDFMAGSVATLDFGRATIGLKPESPAPVATGAPLRIGRTPYIRATAAYGAARAVGEFQIDTGANTAVVFWRTFADRAFPGAGSGGGAVVGVAGVTQARIGRLTSFELAGERMANLAANFADDVRPDDASSDHAGVIGAPAFAGRRITIDYPGQRFWFA